MLGQTSRSGLVQKPLRSPCLPMRVSSRSVRFGRARKSTRPAAFFAGVDPVGTTGVVKIATMLVTSASVAIGALLLGQQFILEQVSRRRRGSGFGVVAKEGFVLRVRALFFVSRILRSEARHVPHVVEVDMSHAFAIDGQMGM